MALPTASDNVFPKVILSEGAAPATPSASQVKLYAKTDGLLYSKDDAGAETAVSGGIAETLLDAKGDIIVASAADTAARLATAANGAGLITASGETTGLKWRLNNDAGTAAPVVTDDSAAGYSVGSRWIDTTNDVEYVCVDASVGAAVWLLTSPPVDLWVGSFLPLFINATGAVAGANSAHMFAFQVNRPMVAAKVYFRIGIQSGNVDAGIYDDAGTRLASAGSTACPAAGVTASLTFTGSVTLYPGRRYWVALAANNTTATFGSFAGFISPTTPGQLMSTTFSASFPLPASVSFAGKTPSTPHFAVYVAAT